MKNISVYLKIHELETDIIKKIKKRMDNVNFNEQFFEVLYSTYDKLNELYLDVEANVDKLSDKCENLIKANLIRQDIIKDIVDDDFNYSNYELISLLAGIIGGINVYRKFIDVMNDNNYSFNLEYIKDKHIVDKYLHLYGLHSKRLKNDNMEDYLRLIMGLRVHESHIIHTETCLDHVQLYPSKYENYIMESINKHADDLDNVINLFYTSDMVKLCSSSYIVLRLEPKKLHFICLEQMDDVDQIISFYEKLFKIEPPYFIKYNGYNLAEHSLMLDKGEPFFLNLVKLLQFLNIKITNVFDCIKNVLNYQRPKKYSFNKIHLLNWVVDNVDTQSNELDKETRDKNICNKVFKMMVLEWDYFQIKDNLSIFFYFLNKCDHNNIFRFMFRNEIYQKLINHFEGTGVNYYREVIVGNRYLPIFTLILNYLIDKGVDVDIPISGNTASHRIVKYTYSVQIGNNLLSILFANGADVKYITKKIPRYEWKKYWTSISKGFIIQESSSEESLWSTLPDHLIDEILENC